MQDRYQLLYEVKYTCGDIIIAETEDATETKGCCRHYQKNKKNSIQRRVRLTRVLCMERYIVVSMTVDSPTILSSEEPKSVDSKMLLLATNLSLNMSMVKISQSFQAAVENLSAIEFQNNASVIYLSLIK